MTGSNGAAASAAAPAPEGFVAVEVGDVEAMLTHQAQEIAAKSGMPASRASALNLLTYIEQLGEMAEVSAVVERLAATHPIRAIGFALDDHIPEGVVRTWVGGSCAGGQDARVCSEGIALAAHSNAAARIASAITSLLKRDLPVIMWWRGGSPFVVRLFKMLAPLATKIVVDSVRFGDGAASLDTLRRLAEYRDGKAAIADLNWERTRAWRATLAACCDDPSVLALVDGFDRCTIECAAASDGPIAGPARALLLAGWLVNRRPQLAGRSAIVGRHTTHAAAGSIAAITLSSSTSAASLAIEWDVDADQIVGTVRDTQGAEIRRLRFAADPQDDASMLDRCIGSFDHNPRFDAVLQAE